MQPIDLGHYQLIYNVIHVDTDYLQVAIQKLVNVLYRAWCLHEEPI